MDAKQKLKQKRKAMMARHARVDAKLGDPYARETIEEARKRIREEEAKLCDLRWCESYASSAAVPSSRQKADGTGNPEKYFTDSS